MPNIWNGEAIKQKMLDAAKWAVDKTMADCVIGSKQSHPGWNNITGTAEGSIRIVAFAQEDGNVVRGIWGSADVDYMIWLELKHGSALRMAADANYPKLNAHIREAFNG